MISHNARQRKVKVLTWIQHNRTGIGVPMSGMGQGNVVTAGHGGGFDARQSPRGGK